MFSGDISVIVFRFIFAGHHTRLCKQSFFLKSISPILEQERVNNRKSVRTNYINIKRLGLKQRICESLTGLNIALFCCCWQTRVFITLLPHGQILWRGSFCVLHSPHYSDHMTTVSMAGVAVVRQIGMDWDIKRSLCYGTSARERTQRCTHNIYSGSKNSEMSHIRVIFNPEVHSK